MMARLGVPKDARNITIFTLMSGYRLIFIISLLSNQIVSVKSKSPRTQKRFTPDDVCTETFKTITSVNGCPTDEENIKKRSSEFNCKDVRDSCTSEDFVYHCVHSGRRILEVCSPRRYVTGKYCVQFDNKIGRVIEDFNVPCPECPFQHYSNESITYATCLKKIQSLTVVQSTVMSTDVSTTSFIASTSTPSTTKLINNNCTFSKRPSSKRRRKRRADCNQCCQNVPTITEESIEYMNSNKSIVNGDNEESSWDHKFGISVVAVFFVVGICLAILYLTILKVFLKTAKTSMTNFDKWTCPEKKRNCQSFSGVDRCVMVISNIQQTG
ncbi:uncharacterized protein LOC134241066 [Saccostrea cucullata]|uniref:uncharacterized protein LOC134241066 n=1 Tax=Saccostrea cuccullata TaxID=36930 RepID=UPI002ED16AD0